MRIEKFVIGVILVQKTYYPKPDDVTQEWVLVDANDHTLGRLATQIASLLLGKHKSTFTPGVDVCVMRTATTFSFGSTQKWVP